MNEKEDRFRQTVDALHEYCEDRANPLTGPNFVKLVDEMFAALDDVKKDEETAA